MKANNKGFSLIELVVAIAILAIAGTALFNGFIMSGRVHMNTTSLQMAEDVAQSVAEEFNSNYVNVLKEKYNTIITTDPASGASITDEKADGVRTVTFTNIPYSYEVRSNSGIDRANFSVDVKLVSKKTANGVETVRDTTYKQSSTEAAGFYEVGDTVGTNTFIIPEVTNIYDGESVVVSEEINQYDNVVVSDLYNVLKQEIEAKNENRVGDAKYDINELANAYGEIYIPFTNITDDKQLIKKTEILVKAENGAGNLMDYYYVVNVEYEFNFDFPLITKGKALGPYLSSEIPDSTNLAEVEGATSSYKISKSGSKYVVSYAKELDEEVTGSSGVKGTFAGQIMVEPDDPGDTQLEILNDGTGDAVPYLYFLYTPFDLYSSPSNGECNDEIEFKYDGPTGVTSNIVRVFFVEQEMQYLADLSKTSKIVNCDIDGSVSDLSVFKVYTNSKKVIDKTGNAFDGKNYLTNSFGESKYNLYDMEIIVKDLNGKTVATYNTVKEE